jgi:SAM-dependent methyltransferase
MLGLEVPEYDSVPSLPSGHSDRVIMEADQNNYFDEAYFQRGDERGTAYRDYAQAARNSPTFHEIAEALAHVFRPKRALEIGCATGAIVRSLNELGVDAHGIDVSDWAVANRLHGNVSRASAAELPFEDGQFDLIYSSHALEHVPAPLIDAVMTQIGRVSAATAYQFHMLPIIGTYPHDYDEELARSNLRADPTHNILESMNWWLDRWRAAGWHHVPMNVCLFNDTGGGELSSGQYILRRSANDRRVAHRAFEWNLSVCRRQFKEIEKSKRQMTSPTVLGPVGSLLSDAVGDQNAPWSDYAKEFSPPIAVEGGTVELAIDLNSPGTRPLRIALVDDSNADERGVLEFWTEFPPGLSAIHVPVDQFRILQGNPRLDRIDKLFFGGSLSGAQFRITGSIAVGGTSVPI